MFKIRKEFADEWLWVEDLDAFVHRRQVNRVRSKTKFNGRIRSFSDAEDTARLFMREFSSKADGIAYRPGEPPGLIHDAGRRLINTFQPSTIKPIEGDAAPFLDFMEQLIPIEGDRREVLRWVATLVARPDIRMRYSLLLVSGTQGVGKTTLGQDILAPLVGPWNTSFPSEETIVDSHFNGWIAHKRLAVIHEIYSGQSRKGYDKLKAKITEVSVDVNEKFIEPYTIENRLHAFACSNSVKALHLDDEDRRWLVPRVTEELRPKEFWIEFHDWLDGDGLGIIRGHLGRLAADPDFVVGTGDHAPSTSMKKEIIEASRSVGQQLAYDLGGMVRDSQEKIVLAVEDVRVWVTFFNQDRSRPLEKPLTLKRALLAAGLKEPRRLPNEPQRRFMVVDPTRTRPRRMSQVVANFEIEAEASWSTLKPFYKLPEDLWSASM